MSTRGAVGNELQDGAFGMLKLKVVAVFCFPNSKRICQKLSGHRGSLLEDDDGPCDSSSVPALEERDVYW